MGIYNFSSLSCIISTDMKNNPILILISKGRQVMALQKLTDTLIEALWNIDIAAKCYKDYEMNDAILLYEKDIHKNKMKAINERYLSK